VRNDGKALQEHFLEGCFLSGGPPGRGKDLDLLSQGFTLGYFRISLPGVYEA